MAAAAAAADRFPSSITPLVTTLTSADHIVDSVDNTDSVSMKTEEPTNMP